MIAADRDHDDIIHKTAQALPQEHRTAFYNRVRQLIASHPDHELSKWQIELAIRVALTDRPNAA